jgi:CPA2 family monovalent cation:H+ antiporter-2
MNDVADLLVARLHGYGAQPAADIATTPVARGEFALILGAMAAGAGLDARLAPFIAGYVLVLAVLGPVAAGRAHLSARVLGLRRAGEQGSDTAPAPVSVAVGADAER